MKLRKTVWILIIALVFETVFSSVSPMGTVYAADLTSNESIAFSEEQDALSDETAYTFDELTVRDGEISDEIEDGADDALTAEKTEIVAEEEEISEEEAIIQENSEDVLSEETSDETDDNDEALGVEMPAGTEIEIKTIPKYYADLDGKGYGVAVAVKNPDGINEGFHRENWDKTVYLQVDSNPAYTITLTDINDIMYPDVKTLPYILISLHHLDAKLSTGEHSVKIAVKYKGAYYTNTVKVNLYASESKERTYKKNEGGDPKKEDYMSGEKGSEIINYYFNFLAQTNDKVTSVKLVRNGQTLATAGKAQLYDSDMRTSPLSTERYSEYNPISLEGYIAYMAPVVNVHGIMVHFMRLEQDIEDGWCDMEITTEKGLKVTQRNAYYSTTKPLIWGMGYRLPWYYGEVVNTANCPYLAAYIYGLNLVKSIVPAYYDDEGIAVTSGAADSESLIYNGGFAYLLNLADPNAEWYTDNLKIRALNLPEDTIDTRTDEEKERTVHVSRDYSLEDLCWWNEADTCTFDYYYSNVKRFEVKPLDSMETLYAGSVKKETALVDLIPSDQRYKFRSGSTKYRVFVYDENGQIVEKFYCDSFKTGAFPDSAVTIALNSDKVTIGVDKTYQLTAEVGPADRVADKSVTWSSSAPKVATVSADGLVTAIKEGTATITATSKTGGKKATCKVTVVSKVEPVTGIDIWVSDEDTELETGDRAPIMVDLTPSDTTEIDVTFTSSNEEVLRVDRDGNMWALSPGEVDITASITSSTGDTYQDTVHITVIKKPVAVNFITLDQNSITLANNASTYLTAAINPQDADQQEVQFTSSNTGVVFVHSVEGHTALIRSGINAGEAVITATVNGTEQTATCRVTVLPDEASENGDEKSAADDGQDRDLWINSIPDQTYTGGKITPAVRVYYGSKELKKGTDYTLSYADNKDAGRIGDTKKGKNAAPRAIVKFKGNYTGISLSRSFNIDRLSIEADSEGNVYESPELSTVLKKGKTWKPVPVIARNGKKMKAGTDFSYAYYSDEACGEESKISSISAAGTYYIKITGKKNYDGTRVVRCHVADNSAIVPMSGVTVKFQQESYDYDEEGVIPTYTVKWNGTEVDPEEYEVSFYADSNKKVGKATMILTGKGIEGEDGISFVGETKAVFKINGIDLSKNAMVLGIWEDMPYTGEPRLQNNAKVYLKSNTSDPLRKDIDYTESYSKNVNVGKATVTYIGKGAYTGKLKEEYTISKADGGSVLIDEIGSVPYEKGGAKPKPVITYEGKTLTAGKDYTLSYADNKAVTTPDTVKTPSVTVKFKGNFSGSKTVGYSIEAQSIADLNVSLPDKAYSKKKGKWMSTPVFTDKNGQKLKAGTDYRKPVEDDYVYFGCYWGALPTAGTIVTLTVEGIGNYAGSTYTGSYLIYSTPISKAKLTVKDMVYTGRPITLTEGDFKVRKLIVKEGKKSVEKELVLGRDFRIVSYSKNTSKGTATVVIQGTGGEYGLGGTRKLTFKIKAKSSKDILDK
ncbi:MAG: Ig-like domain-containing protein [Lachnospiraceae bacterium]|nr:Ig-like domain-containing protein [Lachnospiraceae bacterium]